MNEIKLSLTVMLQGSVMVNQQVAENKPSEFMTEHSMIVAEVDGKKKETIFFKTRTCVPASQSINISRDAYNYMTSSECPYWSKRGEWDSKSIEGRLQAHLHRIAEQVGGYKSTYQVFED